MSNSTNSQSRTLVYYEPVPGMDKDGNLVTCTREVRMSVQDVINFERAVLVKAIPDSRLLDEFIVNHWAHYVED